MNTSMTTINLVAWYCRGCDEYKELEPKNRYCPECGEKMQRCSRYEMFLYDAMLEILLNKWEDNNEFHFKLEPQYPIEDHRGFNWYFDLYLWISGKSVHHGYGELIEVNGMDHDYQPIYGGRGGGYTRDQDKHWEIFTNHKLHKQGIDYRILSNEECKKRNVKETAQRVIDEAIKRSDYFI